MTESVADSLRMRREGEVAEGNLRMRIAVVGGTGRVGRELSEQLLRAGHAVRFLTRGGGAADELARLGAEPVIGSFDDGTADAGFFAGADAAFVMIRSDWRNVAHYPEVAARLATALHVSAPSRVVYLSSIGADAESAGHSTDFGRAERILGDAVGDRLINLRAGWFMENFESHSSEIRGAGTMTTGIGFDVKLPLVATRDVALAAVAALTLPDVPPNGLRELQGPADLTYEEAASVISVVSGRSVRAVHRAPTPQPATDDPIATARWRYGLESNAAFNEHRVKFTLPRDHFDEASTDFATFVREVWKI